MARRGKKFPLENYRILDFGTAWAGPMVSQLLADFGAEVIKVETRVKLDGLRLGRPLISDKVKQGDEGELPDLTPAFHSVNRGKLGITVNAKDPKGLDIIQKLVKVSDVVVDNSSPGTMERLGLDHKSLESLNPAIISISLTAAGESGELKDAVAYAPGLMGIGGIASLVGYRGEGILGAMSAIYGDTNASVCGALAVLLAIYHRERTGKGQHIELSESEALSSLLGEGFVDYFMNGRVAEPEGNYCAGFFIHDNYRCKGADSWVSIAIRTDAEWDSLCSILPELKQDERFNDKKLRKQLTEEIDKIIATWTMNHTYYEVMETLQSVGVAACPALNIEGQFLDEHFREREIFVEVQHPLVGTEVVYGIPWRLSRTPGQVRSAAPLLGQHNTYVLSQILGFSFNEISELMDKKVVY